jgi:hypothetical protein
MTKAFLEYIEDVEMEGSIVSGDGFIIETGEDEGVETYIIESWDDSVLIAADRTTLDILEELGLLSEAGPAVTPGAIPPPAAGQPAAAPAATPTQPAGIKVPQVPPLPQIPQGIEGEKTNAGGVSYELAGGSKLTVNQDGTKSYSGEWGSFTYDKTGKAIKYSSPSMGGMAGEVDLTSGGQTTSYNAGDVSATGTQNAAGKATGTKLTYSPATQAQPTTKTFEAEYQGRNVPLGKPMAGDVKKSKVYVKKPNGNIVKVNFGDKNLSIKKHIPGRRKSFRARHNCDNPGPRWKARYWSCRAW